MLWEPGQAVTVEIEAEMPLPALLAPGAVSPELGMRVRAVLDTPGGGDAWALPAADAAIEGARCDGEDARVARYRAVVPLDDRQAGMLSRALLRCQLLHARTARDASGRRWNAAPHPTEEVLIAVEIEHAGAADAPEAAERERLPVPGRTGYGAVRPGIHTIRLLLTASGEVKLSEVGM